MNTMVCDSLGTNTRVAMSQREQPRKPHYASTETIPHLGGFAYVQKRPTSVNYLCYQYPSLAHSDSFTELFHKDFPPFFRANCSYLLFTTITTEIYMYIAIRPTLCSEE